MQQSTAQSLLERTGCTGLAGLVPGSPEEDDSRLPEGDDFEGDLDEGHEFDFDDDDDEADDFIDEDDDEEGDEEDDFV
ncbi:MAG: hypothetical protein MK082_10475 [Phycisphaerales bacterium]|nr:hypothetical protein [Phycisphaerales bacterium]